MSAAASTAELDPFDLPEWLGVAEVIWSSVGGFGSGHRVAGVLHAAAGDGEPERELPCDLLAVDQAYPAPVVSDDVRRRVHQSWEHGQVLLLHDEGRTVLATPGTSYTAERALDALTRLARAVGADPRRWSVRLGLGR